MTIKKLHIILLFLGIISLQGLSQEIIINTPNDVDLGIMRTDLDGNIIATAYFNPDLSVLDLKAMVIKVDQNFDTIIRYFPDSLKRYACTRLLVTQNNNYIVSASGQLPDNSGYFGQLCLLSYDEDLELQDFNRYDFSSPNGDYLIVDYLIQNDDGRMYGFGSQCVPQHFIAFEINELGDTLRTKDYFTDIWAAHDCSWVMPSHNDSLAFYAFGQGYNAMMIWEVYDVDTNLNLSHDTILLGEDFPQILNVRTGWLNDSIYLAVGAKPGGEKEISMYKANANQHHAIVGDPLLISHPEQTDYNILGNPAFVDPDHIYISSYSNLDYYPNFDATYRVTLLDQDLNIIALKSFGKGGRNYTCRSITATDDLGCVVAGAVHLPDSADTDFEMFIRKISLDEIVKVAEQTVDPYDSDYDIFPNPGGSELYVSTAREGVRMEVFDLNAKRVQSHIIQKSLHQKISMSALRPGTYLLKFTDKEGFSETKKWIKE
jgi:hypothetical protein